MPEFSIYIGNKNYSSWSLRAWLMLKATGVAFEEHLISLYVPGSHEEILRHTPSGKVPVLHHGAVRVWDSLAIGEYLAEAFPEAGLWPAAAAARAEARAVSAEMHAGFQALRRYYPMNMRARVTGRLPTPEVEADLTRIAALWTESRFCFGADGPFLFGRFGIADAMFAPVVSRLRTYNVVLSAVTQAYAEALWYYPPLQDWSAAATAETMVLPQFEV